MILSKLIVCPRLCHGDTAIANYWFTTKFHVTELNRLPDREDRDSQSQSEPDRLGVQPVTVLRAAQWTVTMTVLSPNLCRGNNVLVNQKQKVCAGKL